MKGAITTYITDIKLVTEFHELYDNELENIDEI